MTTKNLNDLEQLYEGSVNFEEVNISIADLLEKKNELLEEINQIKKEQEGQALRMIEFFEKMRATKSTKEII